MTAEEVAKKYIVTENFEKWALSGGADFTDRYGNKMKSLEGMARWTPIINGKKCVKGGVGTFIWSMSIQLMVQKNLILTCVMLFVL